MKMSNSTSHSTFSSTSSSRLDREVERERDERHKNDDARSGIGAEEDYRMKDARESTSSSYFSRISR
ncbi:hypothetical protein [Massilia sp. TWP1-3-3]|uniref:hypothetical protein n=1 Tax=Massilia sp. TWP1-3-3 TaxID=2804573 RepID=UPI003CF231BA